MNTRADETQLDESSLKDNASKLKQPYQEPKLIKLGSIRELTLSGTQGTDDGSAPFLTRG